MHVCIMGYHMHVYTCIYTYLLLSTMHNTITSQSRSVLVEVELAEDVLQQSWQRRLLEKCLLKET